MELGCGKRRGGGEMGSKTKIIKLDWAQAENVYQS
jgi:hypothetical protein